MKNTLTESTAFRTSLQVAEEFGKTHAQVLKDIRELECSEDFRRNNFKETTYTDKQFNQQPMFLMTYGGFIFLISTYGGEKSVYYRIQYIKKFKMMEAFLGFDNSDLFSDFFSKEDM